MRIDTNQPDVPTCPECGFVGPHTPWCSMRGIPVPQQPANAITRWAQETIDIGHAVGTERRRQLGKWGLQDHELTYWLGILMEEVGELARTIIEDADSEYIEKEAVQVAAIASALAQKLHYGGPV
ncbi:MAG: hypothetical protein NTU93_00075 [Arthrobacter sp.]|nr:hypothetical protein [Arthrobacter sp.]